MESIIPYNMTNENNNHLSKFQEMKGKKQLI